MDSRTAAKLRAAGVRPENLLPGTLIGGRPIDAAEETAKAPRGPNKTEQAWIAHLNWLVSGGKVQCYWNEPFRLRMTDLDPQTRRRMFYLPDFLVIMAPAWQCGDPRPRVVEIKGGWVRDDASVKFKLAMAAYGKAFRFSMVQKVKLLNWQTILGEDWCER